MHIRRAVVGLGLLCGVSRLDAQSPYEGVEFCVVRTDTTGPFSYFGYSIRGGLRSIRGRVIQRSYPIVWEVAPNSPADNAGIRVDDELRSYFGFDLSRQYDSIRGRIRPGIPVQITLKRGDSTLSQARAQKPPGM